MEMFCSKCNSKYEINFCPHCGAPLEQNKNVAEKYNQQLSTSSSRDKERTSHKLRWSPKTGQVVKVAFCS
jgi:predicted amidophosphoribosyltransferase